MIQNVLILGSGSAGLLAALTFKHHVPQLNVRIVRSPEIGTIGVGEGTTPVFPTYLFDHLGISRKFFYANARPTWKLGIRYLWGPRDFNFSFSYQLDSQRSDLSMPAGYYCEDDFSYTDLLSSLISEKKTFPRQSNGCPDIQHHAFHVENALLVQTLETVAREMGIEFIDGTVSGAERRTEEQGGGVGAVHLEDGRRLEADFFIDASGFRSELLGKTLEEPFVSYRNSLFCDRAIVGGWERGPDEPILPYTTAETMDAGWAWRIDHENIINRGYVFSSDHLSDDDAREEFLRKNPKANKDGRVVKFRSGRRQRLWVDNVAAIGNAAGFVEPLEATAIMMVCTQVEQLVNLLRRHALTPTPSIRAIYNRYATDAWDEIRDFLGIHYCFNTRLDTPYWRRCHHETDVSNVADLIEFYRENGPSPYARTLLKAEGRSFGIEGWLVMLLGQKVPHRGAFRPSEAERLVWERLRQENRHRAAASMDMREALQYIHHPGWTWNADTAKQQAAASVTTRGESAPTAALYAARAA